MNTATPPAHPLLLEASAARRAGDSRRAEQLLNELVRVDPASAPGWNLLGLIQTESGRFADAEASLRRSLAADSSSPAPWFNLSRAYYGMGAHERELEALDQALSRDAYMLPAILAKADVLRRLKRDDEAVQILRLLLDGIQDDRQFPPPIRQQLAEARAFVEARGAERYAAWQEVFDTARREEPAADLGRAEIYARHRAGLRRIYNPQPINNHFPFLPAYEYFPRELFPWFAQLEEGAAVIRQELLELWSDEGVDFRPYIQRRPGEPVAQWAELNHSPKWTSYFLWEDGQRDEQHIARCQRTAAILEALPLLDMPDKAPTVMFSVLQPRTRIPPHTGSSNTRAIIHLPLVVPPGCGFRVGGDTREWVEGKAWAFDDTIEHEAWNNSDQPRAILIIDAWNPFLTDAEKDIIRQIG